MTENSQTFQFQTEVSKLLKLMIHSLYSNSDVFLRELISNSSDACDKLRFAALNNDNLWGNDSELAIKIKTDSEHNTITIHDNGIGMSREELIENLGTIANSGTAKFLEQMTGDQQKDSHLIGQFGVGFYSAFIVADKVEVYSRKAGTKASEAAVWTSEGEGSFTIETVEKDTRGTSITLHLKDDAKDYTQSWTLNNLIKKYADHITIPVMTWQEKYIPKPETADGEESKEENIEPVFEYQQVNAAKALWTRSKSELSDDDYTQFYQAITSDFSPPKKWAHNQVEGNLNYTSLLYAPSKAPMDLYNRDAVKGLKLYIQRIFIMDDAEQFLPMYLRFIKGVLDCADLPLNVSRELLQNNKITQKLKSALTSRVLKMLNQLTDDTQSYEAFWLEFGAVLKEGLVEDAKNQESVAKLLRYQHSANDQWTSLEQYLQAMPTSQEEIYYLAAESLTVAKQSPHLEYFKDKGIDVLFMVDPIDEWVMSSFTQFQEKSFVDISRGELPENETESKDKENKEENSKTLDKVKDLLESNISEIRFSKRLVNSPACLVLGKDELGPQMRRILESSGQAVPESLPILELNPSHTLVNKLENSDETRFEQLVHVLFGQAQLSDGKALSNPEQYTQAVNTLLSELV